jgi:hypothetical protein
MTTKKTGKPPTEFSKQVGQALKRALKRARATAKMHGTKLYFSRDGKIVAEKP